MDLRKEADNLRRELGETAFLVGNGINMYYAGSSPEFSWKQLLISIGTTYSQMEQRFIEAVLSDRSVTYPEFFDLIQLLSNIEDELLDFPKLKREISGRFTSWQPGAHHRLFLQCARQAETPVLTTNYDNLLEMSDETVFRAAEVTGSGDAGTPLKYPGAPFTDHYPWHAYFSTGPITSALENFALWHIHGLWKYPRSIRLSLADYMALTERAREWLHRGSDIPFSETGNLDNWKGRNSWLDVFLHKHLFIFGLTIEVQEVSIRWLLIEREKYYRLHPDRRKSGCFVVVEEFDTLPEGKRIFFENLNFRILRFRTGRELYEDFFRALQE